MQSKSLFCLSYIIFPILFFSSIEAQQDSSQQLNAGINFFREEKFELSRDFFLEMLKKEPQNESILYNIALNEFKLGNNGSALAHLRKAQQTSPHNKQIQSLIDDIWSQLTIKEIPHRKTFWQSYQKSFLTFLPLNPLLFLNAIFFLIFGYLISRYLGQHKKSKLLEESHPNLSPITLLFGFCFIILCLITATKVISSSQPRGTVIAKEVSVHTGPNSKNAELFKLYEGLEVLVKDEQNKWYKVVYPGGASGWIPKESLHITSGKRT